MPETATRKRSEKSAEEAPTATQGDERSGTSGFMDLVLLECPNDVGRRAWGMHGEMPHG
jgi:hypothetical protein